MLTRDTPAGWRLVAVATPNPTPLLQPCCSSAGRLHVSRSALRV